MADRVVRFTDQFFDRLDLLLPEQRLADGTPSVTDFLLLDLPRVRDALAADYVSSTLPTDTSGIRVFIAAGVLVHRFALYATLNDDTVEVFWITIDREPSD